MRNLNISQIISSQTEILFAAMNKKQDLIPMSFLSCVHEIQLQLNKGQLTFYIWNDKEKTIRTD